MHKLKYFITFVILTCFISLNYEYSLSRQIENKIDFKNIIFK